MRTPEDAVAIRAFIDAAVTRAVMVGARFIGLEVVEQLVGRGIAPRWWSGCRR